MSRLFFKILVVMLIIKSGLSAKEEFLVGFSLDDLQNDCRSHQALNAQNVFKEYPNIKFMYKDAGGKTSLQLKDVDDFIEMGVDVLMVTPRDSKMLTPVISKAYEKGVPVVLLSRKIESDKYSAYVHADNRQIAEEAARYISGKIKNKGVVLMLKGIPEASSAKERGEYFLKEIKKHKGIRVIEKTANYLRTDAIKSMEEVITSGEKIDAIYAHSDSMVIGALLVLKKAGVDYKKMVIVGVDFLNETKEHIKKGEIDASFSFHGIGEKAAKVAVDIMEKKEYKKEYIVKSDLVTEDNVYEMAPKFYTEACKF